MPPAILLTAFTRDWLFADGLNVPAGTKVSFVWKRRGKLSMTEASPVGGDGSALWEASCAQVGL